MAYAEKRAANPGALGLTIGLNAAAVLALALWNPSIFKLPPTPWTTIDVGPISDPPPKQIEDAKPRSKQPVDRFKSTVDTGRIIEDWPDVTRDQGPVINDGGGLGTGDDIVIDPPKQPEIHNIVKRPPMMATTAGDLQPPYPPGLQRLGTEGSVTVRILVGNDGRPKDIVLVRSDHPDFFAAAKSWGMRHWRFKPAAEDEKAVDGWYTLTVKFNIE